MVYLLMMKGPISNRLIRKLILHYNFLPYINLLKPSIIILLALNIAIFLNA
jgi:hypothetical protein